LFHIHPAKGRWWPSSGSWRFDSRASRTLHWFDLCGDRRIRAIRLFQDKNRLDAALHEQRVDRNYETRLLGAAIHSATNSAKVAGVPPIDASQIA